MISPLPSSSSKPQWIPHDYQKRAIKLLISQAAGGLFLDPGLGKTSTCLAAIKILKAKGFVGKVLIIAPLRPAYKVWPDEIEKWENFSGLKYTILHGKNKEEHLNAEADIYIINPEGLQWLSEHHPLPVFDCLIVDESTKFKDSTTKRFRILKAMLPNFSRRWILTGTPVPNGISDLFGQIFILDGGGSLGRYITHFRNSYFFRSGYSLYEWSPRPGAFEEIVGRIAPLIFRISAGDYLAMPELRTIPLSVELPGTAMARYKAMEDDYIALIESDSVIAGSAAVAGVKCRQIANGAVYDAERKVIKVHDAKLDALVDLLEELGGAPTLVLYEFQHDVERILERLPHAQAITSGMSPAKFERLVDAFNGGHVPVLLGHPASMAHGLNLQKSCRHIVWFGIPWNLEHYDQAIARVYRQGQKSETVFVYQLTAKGTLDEEVAKVLAKKDRSQQALLKALGVAGNGLPA